MAKGFKSGGRQVGSVNKATLEAREAIGKFVDNNAHKLQDWLDRIADGVPDPNNENKFLSEPNPEKAFNLYQSVIEYHVPKLARSENHTELVGKLEFGWKSSK